MNHDQTLDNASLCILLLDLQSTVEMDYSFFTFAFLLFLTPTPVFCKTKTRLALKTRRKGREKGSGASFWAQRMTTRKTNKQVRIEIVNDR